MVGYVMKSCLCNEVNVKLMVKREIEVMEHVEGLHIESKNQVENL